MGHGKYDNKKKTKRKKGKKFVYKNPTEMAEKVGKKNPFEAVSQKKFMKHGKKDNELIDEYKSRFSTNSFVDRRIGENSKNLSYDDKMKLRYKAQQMINLKNRKNKFSILNEDENLGDNDRLTHRGRNIDENASDAEKSDDEFENNVNIMEEMDITNGKLSKKEIIQNIINKSKIYRREKQELRNETKEKISQLDDNYPELISLLKKRGRSIGKSNDDYDKLANTFSHAEKTHPTSRIKTELEMIMDKEKTIERQNKKRNKDFDEDMDDVNLGADDKDKKTDKIENTDDKKLSKKDRIEKLIGDRLNRANKVLKEDMISKKKSGNEAENEDDEDNLSDLDEFDHEGEEGEYEEGEEGEYEDGEFDEDSGSEGSVSEESEKIKKKNTKK